MLKPDAVVVGSGPNGLAAAITLAQAGKTVVVREAAAVAGGGLRSAALTNDGFTHDICAGLMPLAAASPFFRALPLHTYGLKWIEPPVALAHPFDDGTVALLLRSIDATIANLDVDSEAYRSLIEPFVQSFENLLEDALAPLHVPKHPLLLGRFSWLAVRSVRQLMRDRFRGPHAQALLGTTATHAIVRMDRMPSAAFALVLIGAAHHVGWPLVAGGSQCFADALISYFKSLGGDIVTDAPVHSIDELAGVDNIFLDLTPPQIVALAGHRLPKRYLRKLERYRFGPGVFKVDWALSEPVPWTAVECRRAGALHLGGSLEEIVESERVVWNGGHPERPLVILSQPSIFDPARAPSGAHTLWGYCHVPNSSTFDMTQRIESQIERFAPGFRDVIIARSIMSPAALQDHNPNLVGGEIGGGENSLAQTFFRPVAQRVPYRTPLKGVYICSASTPPGGAIHGMCGYHAAHAMLRTER